MVEPAEVKESIKAELIIAFSKYLKLKVMDIEGIINADYSEYNNFVESLQLLHSEIHAYIYQKYMKELIETTEEVKKNFEKIFEEMPAE